MNPSSLRVLSIASALALALAGAGCKEKASDAAPAATATATAAAATAAAASAAAAAAPAAEPAKQLTDDAIASSEDFEDEVFAKISDTTYKTDLEALKKEIEGQ